MHQCYLSYLLVLTLAATMLGVPGCGGKSGVNQALSGGSLTALETTNSKTVDIGQTIAQIEGSKAPEGVDSELWGQLTGELVRQLQLRNVSHLVSSAPSGVQNVVTDLELVEDAGNYSLMWTYVNVGDYDQNSEVNLADITPIALNFSATSADANWDEAQLADGDGNGEVNLADITPIAVNFLAAVASYNVYGRESLAAQWLSLGSVEYPSTGPEGPQAFSFALDRLDFAYYRILPNDGMHNEGIGSDAISALDPLLFEPLTISQSGAVVNIVTDVVFSIGLDEALGEPLSADIVELDEAGDVLSVVGALQDNGNPAIGDQLAGDRVFFLQASLNSAAETAMRYAALIGYDIGEGPQSLTSNIVSFRFYDELTLQRAQEIIDSMDDVDSRMLDRIESMTVSEASELTVGELLSDPDVLEAGVLGDGLGVWWETVDGYPCGVYFPRKGMEQAISSSSQLPAWPPASDAPVLPDNAGDVRTTSGANDRAVGNLKVLVLAPFNNIFATEEIPELSTNISDNDWPQYELTLLTNEQCDVNSFKQMGQYGVVIVTSHGTQGYEDIETDSSVCTREAVTVARMAQHQVDLRQKNLTSLWIHIDRNDRRIVEKFFAIRSGFISKYISGMPDSVVYMSACQSGTHRKMADAFLDADAETYFGYDGTTNETESREVGLALFDELLLDRNTGEALALVPPLSGESPLVLFGARDMSISKSRYILTDLGTLPGGAFSSAADINDEGQVTGQSHINSTVFHAFLWDETADPQMADIGTLGGAWSRGEAINDAGHVIGISKQNDQKLNHHSFLFNGSEMVDLDPSESLGGGGTNVTAADINSQGTIVGSAFFKFEPEDEREDGIYAFRYFGGFEYLGVLDPTPNAGDLSNALGINEAGWIVGYATDEVGGDSFVQPFMYIGLHGMFGLGLTESATSGQASAVNSSGHVVGYMKDAPGNRTAMMRNAPADLVVHTLSTHISESTPAALMSEAVDINNAGMIIGYAGTQEEHPGEFNPVIWTDYLSDPDDLNMLIPGDEGWWLVEVSSINNHGQIVGTVKKLGEFWEHAVLLTPRD